MKEHKEKYSVIKTAGVFGVNRSGFYAWEGRKPSRHEAGDLEPAEIIQQIFKERHGRYGSLRIWEELKSKGLRVGRKRVERLMRKKKLWAGRHRKHVKTTDSSRRLAAADNILNRDFCAVSPGEKWVSDITYLRTIYGRLYSAGLWAEN
jgi:transposase InsO family protein